MVRAAITHSPWSPGRTESFERLYLQLDPQLDAHTATVFRSCRREPVAVWARRLWDWVSKQDGPVLCLQDDVEVHPRIVGACEAILQAVGEDEIVCLHVQEPAARSVAARGFRWHRNYWLTAPGYLLPPKCASDMLDFWSGLHRSTLGVLNEDNVAVHWAWSVQRPFLTTLPSLVLHDATVPSTLGYDHHDNRVSTVPWSEDVPVTDPAFWQLPKDVPYVATADHGYLERCRRAFTCEGGPCSACLSEPAVLRLGEGVRLGLRCAVELQAALMRRLVCD